MRIDSAIMTNASITGSFSGSITGNIVADSVAFADVTGKPTLLSGSGQVVVSSTSGYSDIFNNPTFTGTVTIPTQATSDDSTKAASTAFVQDRIAEVIDSAPAALDTLNELAAALGDDPNLSGSLATTISTKLAKSSNLSDLADTDTALTNLGFSAFGKTLIDDADQATAQSTLGLTIGTDVQAYDADLSAIAGLAHTDGNFIVGNGSTFVVESGATARTSIGLGTSNDVQFDSLGIGTAAPGTTGVIRATNDIIAYYSSDARLKDNVTTLNGALDKVKQIRGVEFDWNSNQDVHEGHDIGVIAQEVEAVYPELVHDRDNGYKAVDYVKLTAVLIQAVKELSTKVEQLEK